MADYIELINSLRQEAEFEAYLQPHSANETPKLLFEAADVIEKLSEERKKGKNIATDYDEVDQFVCSECGIELQNWVRVERDEDDGDETHHEYRFNFCPNCGSEMSPTLMSGTKEKT